MKTFTYEVVQQCYELWLFSMLHRLLAFLFVIELYQYCRTYIESFKARQWCQHLNKKLLSKYLSCEFLSRKRVFVSYCTFINYLIVFSGMTDDTLHVISIVFVIPASLFLVVLKV